MFCRFAWFYYLICKIITNDFERFFVNCSIESCLFIFCLLCLRYVRQGALCVSKADVEC